jgi:hypothetical protein
MAKAATAFLLDGVMPSRFPANIAKLPELLRKE